MTTFSFLKIIIDNSMKYLYYINIFIWLCLYDFIWLRSVIL